jgi:hypothetical protein
MFDLQRSTYQSALASDGANSTLLRFSISLYLRPIITASAKMWSPEEATKNPGKVGKEQPDVFPCKVPLVWDDQIEFSL